MNKSKQNEFITFTADEMKKSWMVVISLLIFLDILTYSGVVGKFVEKTVFTSALYDYLAQIVLTAAVIYSIHDYLISSWKRFIDNSVRSILRQIGKSMLIVLFMRVIAAIIITFAALNLGVNMAGSANQASLQDAMQAFPVVETVVSVLVAPFTEECIYRGIIFGTIAKRSPVLAMWVSAVLFALVHVISSFVAYGVNGGTFLVFVQYFGTALALSIIYKKYKNIWINCGVHMVCNIISTILFFISI